MGRKAKSYLGEIAKALSLDVKTVGNMTINEVDNMFLAAHNLRVEERMKTDLDNQKRIELLLENYDRYIQYFGESFLRGLCQADLSIYLDDYRDKNDKYDDDEERKKYLTKSVEERRNYYTPPGTRYYKLHMSYIGDAVEDSIIIKYPILKKYCPKIQYSYEGFHSQINFSIVTGKKEDGSPQVKVFTCVIESFLNKDIDSMIEDYLQSISYTLCKDKTSEKYIATNDFLSSPATQEFLQTVRELP